jgi:ribosomal protein S7
MEALDERDGVDVRKAKPLVAEKVKSVVVSQFHDSSQIIEPDIVIPATSVAGASKQAAISIQAVRWTNDMYTPTLRAHTHTHKQMKTHFANPKGFLSNLHTNLVAATKNTAPGNVVAQLTLSEPQR